MYPVFSITEFGVLAAGLGNQQCAVHQRYEALCVGDGGGGGLEGNGVD